MRHLRVPVLLVLSVIAVAGTAGCVKPPPTILPNDGFSVADASQATGRRMNFPLPNCTQNPSVCDEIRLINQLDGWDIDPRVSIGFNSAIDLGRVTRDTVFLRRVGDSAHIGLRRLVVDPTTNFLYGHPEVLLREATRYEVVVTAGVNGQAGTATFTTMSATKELRSLRAQLDNGSAYTAAGIATNQRGLDFVIGGQRRVFDATNVLRPRRFDDLRVGSGDGLEEQTVFDSADLSAAGHYAFGSFLSPQWIDGDRKIPNRPTGSTGPPATGRARVGFALILPRATVAAPKPAGGWPVAIFGPGITRSKYDVFLAADENLKKGIATIAIDPVGHAFGPATETGVDLLVPPSTVRFSGFGRALDVDGNGVYGEREGLSTRGQPSRYAGIALRDGLRQTALDNMALARAIARGADVDGDGSTDLRTSGIGYYAQSLGGIYGTMLMATDPSITFGALNVPGGPVLEIARLAPGFRCEVTTELARRIPSQLNGGNSGCDDGRRGFTESSPLFAEPPVTNPAPGAVAIQHTGSRTNWLHSSGSPESFAPLLRLRPPSGQGAKRILYQFAFGDQTVPNPTSAAIMRAGALQNVTTLYRNDRTPTAASDPHGFLIDPRITGRQLGLLQVAEFLDSAGATIIDPDTTGNVFEVPITDPATLERLNF